MQDSQTSAEILRKAAETLKHDGIIVFPTDTAYGLGCDFESEQGIARILQLKGRTDTHFTIITGSLEQVQQFFMLNHQALELAQQYWPGPLSIVVNDQFAVRVPKNDIARILAQQYGRPIIATSANISKQPPEYTLAGAQRALGMHTVDLWIDGGELEQRPPSTVVDTRGPKLTIIRQGAITLPT